MRRHEQCTIFGRQRTNGTQLGVMDYTEHYRSRALKCTNNVTEQLDYGLGNSMASDLANGIEYM